MHCDIALEKLGIEVQLLQLMCRQLGMLESVKQMIWTGVFHLPEQVCFESSAVLISNEVQQLKTSPLLAMTSICADIDALPKRAKIQQTASTTRP